MNSASHHIGPDSAPDRYRLLNSIGRGGEAVLYRAEIELDGAPETVVVKVLDSKTTITVEQFRRLSSKWQEQAELLRFVNRPGVVGVREHFEGPPIHGPGDASTAAGRALVLVMNHVEGLDLRDWRAERTLATHAERREALRALEQIADVLDWLHSGRATPSGRSVVHGDLSPGNVMVDEHGQATLVDFGLSKLTADHQTAEVWFTPGFAAPEVFEGKRTPATDRYAFGAIAYFMLSGQAPPGSPEQLRTALLTVPQVAAAAPDRIERILRVCAAEPDRRPESLSEWVKDVRSAVVSTTVTGSSASPVRDAVPGAEARDAGHDADRPVSVPPPPLLPPVTPPGSPPAGTPGSPAPVAGEDVQPVFPPPITASADPGVPLPATANPGPATAPRTAPGGMPEQGPETGQQPYAFQSPQPSQPPQKKKRKVLRVVLPAVAVLATAVLGVVAAQSLWSERKGDDSAKGGSTAQPVKSGAKKPPKDSTASAGPEQSTDPSQEADPGEVAAADSASLTTLDIVAKGEYATLAVGSGTVENKRYDTALVPDGGDAECSGAAEYNLSRVWTTLSLVMGIDDSSENKAARVDIEVDGKSLYSGQVLLGVPRTLNLDVKNGLRLRISYSDTAEGGCDMGYLVLGAPTLKK
ncbi:protein kinase [Streptomyces sp. NBC_00893]|uniref:protein kinase domain-containing protein n=1 Tax=Streptomyces sp. NBC_00893 TaxID=2975862 RepID=UPI002257F077|nr:protein kinase [Streptomyces sp. NBC_00893]MCX4845018.1 protein kinase [Streptomyces sp. NBC_00893]